MHINEITKFKKHFIVNNINFSNNYNYIINQILIF
jgi:hypothetical protein